MKRIIFSKAYLSSGWANNVYVEIDENGFINDLKPDVNEAGVHKVSGYAMPGMNNVHSHAFQRAMAGLAEYSTSPSDSFWTWRDLMYRFAEKINPEDLYAISSQLYLEMIKAGYVSVAEFHYLHRHDGNDSLPMSEAIIAASKDTGIALCHLPVLYMASGFGGKPLNEKQHRFDHSVDGFLSLHENLNSIIGANKNQHLGFAFHSLRAVPEKALHETLSAIKDGPVHIHISEQMQEVNDSQAWSGKRPVEWLYDNVDVDHNWCLIHATHLDEDEISKIANSGAVVGLCPTTEANLGDGLFPLNEYLKQNGKIAIGSDSHVSISLIEELRMLEYGQRLKYEKRNIAVSQEQIHTGHNLYEKCLAGGANASGFDNGALQKGKRADIIVLDESSPLIVGTPDKSIIDRFIFNGNVNPVKHVYVAGNHLVKDYVHHDEIEITNRFLSVMQRLKKILD